MTDFGELIRALSGSGVRFVLVGGVAATLHGSARLTQDVDVVYARDAANLSRIAQALAPLQPYLRGAPPGLPFSLDEKTLPAGLNFTLSTSVGDIDLLGEITGIGGYEALAGHTIEVELFGALPLPGPADAHSGKGRGGPAEGPGSDRRVASAARGKALNSAAVRGVPTGTRTPLPICNLQPRKCCIALPLRPSPAPAPGLRAGGGRRRGA